MIICSLQLFLKSQVAGISFEEAGRDVRVIDNVIITNEDLQKDKNVEVER